MTLEERALELPGYRPKAFYSLQIPSLQKHAFFKLESKIQLEFNQLIHNMFHSSSNKLDKRSRVEGKFSDEGLVLCSQVCDYTCLLSWAAVMMSRRPDRTSFLSRISNFFCFTYEREFLLKSWEIVKYLINNSSPSII